MQKQKYGVSNFCLSHWLIAGRNDNLGARERPYKDRQRLGSDMNPEAASDQAT